MRDLGYFGSRILFMTMALIAVVMIIMVIFTRDTWDFSRSSPIPTENSLRQKLTYRSLESEESLAQDDESGQQSSQQEISAQHGESSEQTQGMDILQAYRFWDSKVGCGKFQEKIQDYEHRNTSFRSLQPEHLVKCEELQQQHVSILVRESTWIPDYLNGFHTCSCGLTCLWTKSEVLAHEPDVCIYEGSDPPWRRKQGEPLRVYVDLEADRPRSDLEDIFVSYHSRADLQASYVSKAMDAGRNQYISPLKRTDVLVYWSSSRCVQKRQEIAAAFLPVISHHSFGKCFNNVGRQLDSDEDPLFDMYPNCKTNGGGTIWLHHIHCAMSHYMFALAIENTDTESYVTEKLFYALEVGTVPIYFGAPNVLDLVPPNSIIQASEFKTIVELVAYVKEVAQDPLQYAEFHAWRRCGELGNYRHTWSVSFDNVPCRLSAVASKLGGKNNPDGGPSFVPQL
ncbi:unnamed protein product [Calypogeia fissa]